jgi:subtilisin-like proprotein convertase family protein
MKTFTLLIGLFLFSQISQSQYYYNKAFSFSGTAGDYAATDPGTNLSITGNFTVECWVNPINAVTPPAQIIIQKRLGSNATGYTLYLNAGKIAIRTNSTTQLTGNTIIPNNVWTHVAASYNSGSGLFTIYVNGVSDGTITVAGAAPAADTDSLRFASGFNSPLAGKMDEIRIWSVQRSAAQLLSTMRLPLGEPGGQYAGLVASWRANNVAGGTGTEEINGYTAHLNGTATYANYSNEPGGYMAFNTGLLCTGTIGSYVAIPSSSQLSPATAMTLECWIWTSNTNIQVMIAKGSANYPYRILKSISNTFRAIINGTALGSGNYGGIIPTSKWTHLAFTYDAGTGAYVYYMNGVQTQAGTQSLTIPTNTDSVTIGGGINLAIYDGSIDEVRICNYVKTAAEIQGGMYTSIDSLNAPHPSNTNVTFSFEGTLAGTNGAPRGIFIGPGITRFTQVVDNPSEFPAPIDRWDAGNFYYGFNTKYSDLDFGGSPATITDSILISQSLTISDVNLFVAIHHTSANEINISLKNPAGTTTRILYPGGGPNAGMHMITIFDDQADSTIGGTIRAPWSPRVKPTNTLSIFNSQNSVGYWKLIVTDNNPGSDNGNLVGWGIQLNNQTLVGVNGPTTEIPHRFLLYQNYPNPFNPATVIKYDVARDINVKIIVYDLLGREVQVLVNDFKRAGSYSLTLNAQGLASGVYFYKIEAGEFVNTKKMLLIK